MKTLDACKLLDMHRGDAIVVCTMGAMNALDKLPVNPLAMACVPLMGGAASIGLGLALARPERKVFVFDGDASLLMELGGLVSIAHAKPKNFFHFVFNNSIQFAGLGNLDTPGARRADMVAMASACGFDSSQRITNLEDLEARLPSVLNGPAPSFVELVVEYDNPSLGIENPAVEMTDERFSRMGDEIRRIRRHLGCDAEIRS
jgi:thiamine pyrophosphate-dependent acetolactate synthase large subunit-like protein